MPKITNALQDVPELDNVQSDREDKGLEVELTIDRNTAARLGISSSQIDNTLYDALRPAPGVDDLQRFEPVPCRDGRGTGVLAEPGDLEGHLCLHRRRRGQRHCRHRRGHRHDDAHAGGQRHGAVGTQRRRRRRGRAAQPAAQRADQQRGAAARRPARRSAPRSRTMVPLSAFSSFGPRHDAARDQSRMAPSSRRRSRSIFRRRLARPGDGGDRTAR